MKQKLMAFVLMLLCFNSYSQTDFNYSSTAIADSLKKDANTVIRLDEAALEIQSPSKYDLKVHQIITILNAEGAHNLRQRLSFDKLCTVSDAGVRVYNDLGILIKKYSKKDFLVRAAFDGFSLATDDKVMELEPIAPSYPCTIDVQYERKTNGYLELPDWYINRDHCSTEIFHYSVTVPSQLAIRYRSLKLDVQPSVREADNKKNYDWLAKNITAAAYQKGGYPAIAYSPRIEVAPTVFEYDGYPGKFSNWNDYGAWSFALFQEVHPFSQDRINEIKSLVAAYTEKRDKIKVLYDYLKANMRYVSLQFGIGGFKPFPVKYVDENKYGDCKALTNYMRYLLDVVGIKSYPALINAGNYSPPIDTLFPASVFNHVILCIPDKTDTTWLECTSNCNAMGFLGTFTEDKNALLLTEKGGIMVRTPASKAENNVLSSYNEIYLDAGGGAKADSYLFATGDVATIFNEIKKGDADEQKELFVNYLHFKQADGFTTSVQKDSATGFVFNLHFDFEKLYNFKAGNKFFFPQGLRKIYNDDLKNEKREIEFVFEYPYQKTDTTVINLSTQLAVDELPSSVYIKKEFAEYKKEFRANAAKGQLIIITSLVLKKHIIPPHQYNQVYDFFNKVKGCEDQNIVLKKL